MITNKDIRVENGNLVLNGDKFPLDGQSPETIMEIVEDNSDTTPTENSTAPITSGGVYTALGTKQDTLTFDTTPTDESTNPVTSGGVYTALGTKQDTLTFDTAPTDESTNPVTSGGVYTAIDELISSTATTDAVDVNGTFQIPTEMLAKKVIVISVNRAAWCGSIVIPTNQITDGNCANGVKIVTGDGANPTTDKYAVLTISNTGLITVVYLSNWSPLYIRLNAI